MLSLGILNAIKNNKKNKSNFTDELRSFRHDFDNIIASIGGYLKTDDIDGLKKYYSEIYDDRIKVNNIELLNPHIINNSAIYNLLVIKYKKATDLHIKFNFEFFFDFSNLKMPVYEFSRILGILLDNAIEATNECEDKEISLIIRESQRNRVQILTLENTFCDNNIDTKHIFEKGFSSKSNHSGLGLWKVNKIVSSKENVVLKTSHNSKTFSQQLEIYY